MGIMRYFRNNVDRKALGIFTLLTIFNLFLILYFTSFGQMWYCSSKECLHKYYGYIYTHVASLSACLIGVMCLYVLYGKRNVIKLLRKMLLVSIPICLFVFIFLIIPLAWGYNSTSTIQNVYKNIATSLFYAFWSVCLYVPIIGIVFSQLPNINKQNLGISQKAMTIFLLYFATTLIVAYHFFPQSK